MDYHTREHFYDKDWFIWLSLIIFAPLGIFLLWRRGRYSTISRVVISCIFAFLFLLPFGVFNTRSMTAQNKPYEQTEFARVSWSNNPLYNWTSWWRSIFTRRTVPSPSPVPAVPKATPSVTPYIQPGVTPAVPGLPGVPGVVPGVTGVPASPATTGAPAVTTPVPVYPAATEPPAATPALPAEPATTPGTQTSNYQWKALQDKIFDLTNVERQKNGVQPFVYNAAVEKYAVAKSQDMVTNNYFDHNSPTNGYFYDIWKRDGFAYSSGAENIYTMTDQRGFANQDVNALAQSIVNAWMNSEGHRRNILNSALKELGVGVANNDGKLDATQLFYTR